MNNLKVYVDVTAEFSKDGIKSVHYQETEHYKTTKSFLDNPEKMLHYLLKDTDI